VGSQSDAGKRSLIVIVKRERETKKKEQAYSDITKLWNNVEWHIGLSKDFSWDIF
jgi:hypothetical protein